MKYLHEDGSLDENRESLAEGESEIVNRNVNLLELKFGDRKVRQELDDATSLDLLAIKVREGQFAPQGLEIAVVIIYDTKTGMIQNPHGSFADFSALRTSILEGRDGSKQILLYQPGNMLSSAQYSAIVAGNDIPQPEDRRVLPERISPDNPDMLGRYENWGKSEFTESAEGDLIVLKSVQTFNKNHQSPDDQPG